MAKRQEITENEVGSDVDIIPPPQVFPKEGRAHRATFASDNLEGGYMIRVEGPNAGAFARREVPVTRFDGSETVIKTDKLVWKGLDNQSGKPVALYRFTKTRKPKTDADREAF